MINWYLVRRHRLLAVGALGGGVDPHGGQARRDVLAQLLQHDRRAGAHRLRVGEGLVEDVFKGLSNEGGKWHENCS